MEGFRFTMSYRVRIADINYGGHVANAALLSIFQDGRIAYLGALGPYSELELGGCGMIQREAHVYYRAEMFHGDELQVGVRVGELRNATFVMEYRIEREGVVTAEGNTLLAAFDYRARKPVRLPRPFREALEAFERR